MNKIEFENASVVTPAKVTINGTDYEVTPAQLTTVENYLSAETLNDMQDNIEDAINKVNKVFTTTDANTATETGNYYIGGDGLNIPVTGYSCYLEVLKLTDSFILQRATRASNSSIVIHQRQKYSGVWSNWIQQ